jgi:hypothetical protein
MLAVELPIEYRHKRKLAEFTNLVKDLYAHVEKLEEYVSGFTHYYKRNDNRGAELVRMLLVDIDIKITTTIVQLNALHNEYRKALDAILSLQLTQTTQTTQT